MCATSVPPQPTCSMVGSTKILPLRVQCELEKELILYPRHFGPNMKDQLTNKLIAKAAKAHAHAPPTIEKVHGQPPRAAFTGGGHLLRPLWVHHYGDRGPRARQREDPRGYAAICQRVCTAGCPGPSC